MRFWHSQSLYIVSARTPQQPRYLGRLLQRAGAPIVPVRVGSLAHQSLWADRGRAWVPDLGRNIPAAEAPGNLDASIVQRGKLISEYQEGALRPHISAGYTQSVGRAQAPTWGSMQPAQRVPPIQPSLHQDVQLILLNKNIPDMRCRSDLRPPWQTPWIKVPAVCDSSSWCFSGADFVGALVPS